jgi:hypothetical protein
MKMVQFAENSHEEMTNLDETQTALRNTQAVTEHTNWAAKNPKEDEQTD